MSCICAIASANEQANWPQGSLSQTVEEVWNHVDIAV